MPSKENIVVVQDTGSAAGYMYATADVAVEELVAAIKQNLRLKTRSYCAKSKRMSPYDIPNRTNSCGKDSLQCCAQCRSTHVGSSKTNPAQDDPYEMLQVLLREGSLIKEAVKRLQLGLTAPKDQADYYCDDCDVSSNGSQSRTFEL